MRIWQVGPRTSCWVILEWRQIVPVQEDQERWRGQVMFKSYQLAPKLNGFVGRKKIYLVLRVEG